MYLHVLAAAAPLSHSPVLPVAANLPQAPEDHYRLAAFIKNFLRPACLAPASVSSNYPVAPKISALQLVERFTRYLPLRNGATVLGDIEIAAQLFEHLPKDFLEPREYFECQKAIGLISASIQSQVANEAPSDLVCSLPVAMALELDYLLLQYADLSVEHSLLSTDLRKRLDSISLANKRLSKLVQKATNLLVSGNATPGSPLQQLTEIARKLATSQPNPSSVTSSVSDSKITFGGNSGSNITFASCPIDTFMQHLTAMSRKPVPSRPEFAGVLAAGNSKGPLPLYTGLKGEDN